MKKNSVRNKNEIYITLKSERNYFQGDIIDGTVVLDLITATKTQNVKLILEGIAMIHNKPTTIYTTTQVLMEAPTDEKFVLLDAHSHSYHFHIQAPSSRALPSTLDIPGLLSIQYKLIAVQTVQFGMWDFPKVHPTTEKEVSILEHINVSEFPKNYNEMREVRLMGLDKKIRVAVDLLRSAAVKGATIPISVTIDHVGVMVKDKAIKVSLFRNVYHRNTRLNINGPETISSTNGSIMITGPIDFSDTTKLKLSIPSKVCPTVEETGKTFKVEYLVNIVINLNEESPHIRERGEEIVIFDVPFTIGTYPQLDYCIDDDEDDEEGTVTTFGAPQNNRSEVENVSTNKANTYTADVVKAPEQVDLDSSEHVLPQMIEDLPQQKQSTTLKSYKPDEKPDEKPVEKPVVQPVVQPIEQPEPVNPPKKITTPYEPSVQLPEFVEPSLPEQIIEVEPEKKKKTYIPYTMIKNNKDAVSPQEQEVSLHQEQQMEWLSKESPKKNENKQKEEERPMSAHLPFIRSDSCISTTYLPTPISENRPSSPSPTYQVSSSVATDNNPNNVSLPMQTTYTTVNNTGINIAELPYQLPMDLGSPPRPPPLEKRASYLSMNQRPESPSLPLLADPNAENRRPPLPPRNSSPFPQPYNNDVNTNPRLNDNGLPVFDNRPQLPPRTNTASPFNNSNDGYSSPPPSSPPPYPYDNSMPRPYQQNHFYNSYQHNSSSSLYSQPSTDSPNALPMQMPSPSHSQTTNNYPQRPSTTVPSPYPALAFNMPTPQHQQQKQQPNQPYYYHR